MKVLLLIFGALAVVTTAEKLRFDHYQVYRVTTGTKEQVEELEKLEQRTAVPFNLGYSFWRSAHNVGEEADIMVSPKKVADFVSIFEKGQYKYHLMIENVQKLMDAEIAPSKSRDGFGWNAYYRIGEIYNWLQELADKYPQVEVIKGGNSFEGREILGIKISYREGNPGVFIESGIHAREWITPATVTYIANELLTSTDPAVRRIAERHDWYIFPSVNPDGYEFSHTNNRMWRKTRAPSGLLCTGADANRNWGYNWMQGGASSFPCSETFAGASAFSEIETRTLSAYITSIQDRIQTYLSFHSFTQLLLLPYGHTAEHLDNYDDLMKIGTKAVASLARRYGTQYRYGNIVETIYIASGGSMDWVKGTYKTPITYTYELRDLGEHGFLLPPEQIIPTGEETLDSVVTILEEAEAMGYYTWSK